MQATVTADKARRQLDEQQAALKEARRLNETLNWRWNGIQAEAERLSKVHAFWDKRETTIRQAEQHLRDAAALIADACDQLREDIQTLEEF